MGRPTSFRGSGLCSELWAPTPTPPESLAPGCSEPCLLAALPRAAEEGAGETPEPLAVLLRPLVLNGNKLCHVQGHGLSFKDDRHPPRGNSTKVMSERVRNCSQSFRKDAENMLNNLGHPSLLLIVCSRPYQALSEA